MNKKILLSIVAVLCCFSLAPAETFWEAVGRAGMNCGGTSNSDQVGIDMGAHTDIHVDSRINLFNSNSEVVYYYRKDGKHYAFRMRAITQTGDSGIKVTIVSVKDFERNKKQYIPNGAEFSRWEFIDNKGGHRAFFPGHLKYEKTNDRFYRYIWK